MYIYRNMGTYGARCTFIVEAKGRQEGRKRWLLIEVEEEEG